ncbi:MAG: hypothetical protein F4X98_05150 [Gammaproteobacteria bacterium]|nr:hypothetical protein [Gammaproteobacteria bacterium]
MTLLAAAFLAGLATLAVPLWLHRMSERAPAERNVSSLMLMRETEEPVRTRRRLAHKILLALRLAVLAAVTLAFAQPALEVLPFGAAPADAPAKLIVVDGSFSMRQEGAFPRALEVVRELMADGGESRVVLAADRLTLVSDAAALEPGWTRFDFTGLPPRLDAVFATLANREAERDWVIHVVSDFQATAVPDRLNALVEGAAWPFVLHPVGAGAVGNSTVENVVISGSHIEAAISAYGESRPLVAALRRDGRETGRIGLTADSPSEPVRFEIPPAGRRSVLWEVTLDDPDAIAEDNVYRVVQPPLKDIEVGLLAGGPPDADAGSSRAVSLTFLGAALNAIDIDPVDLGTDAPWPDTLDALIVVDPGELAMPLVRRLERHLNDGGGALIAVGPRTRRHGALPLGGAVIANRVATGVRRVVVTDSSHPVNRTSWRGVEVRRSLAMPAVPGETLLALVPSDEQAPSAGTESPREAALLVEQRFGKGRLLTLLTAVDRDWSSLVLRPAFVGFVRDAVGYMARALPSAAYAGEAVAMPVASVQIFDSDNERVLSLDSTVGRPVVRIPRPGFYTIRAPGREAGLAVNVDPRESDLRPVSAEFLERWQSATVTPGAPDVPGAPGNGGVSADRTLSEANWHPLAPWLLAFAAILLMIESMAANIGRFKVPFRLPFPSGRTRLQ